MEFYEEEARKVLAKQKVTGTLQKRRAHGTLKLVPS